MAVRREKAGRDDRLADVQNGVPAPLGRVGFARTNGTDAPTRVDREPTVDDVREGRIQGDQPSSADQQGLLHRSRPGRGAAIEDSCRGHDTADALVCRRRRVATQDGPRMDRARFVCPEPFPSSTSRPPSTANPTRRPSVSFGMPTRTSGFCNWSDMASIWSCSTAFTLSPTNWSRSRG